MTSWFNTADPCFPEDHYMLPDALRLLQVDPVGRVLPYRLVQQKGYFVIHAPRQIGKTTAIMALADRITANGDAANKIGTYGLAIIAQAHNVPFFVAAPLSTIDFSLADGGAIEIEERDPKEVSNVGATVICPAGVEFFNPAFDVTPARLIAGIVTEFGTFAPGDLGQLRGKA